MYRTDDPLADFARYDRRQQSRLNRLPKCDYCGEPIEDDYLYEINDVVICEECLCEHHRKDVEYYVD